MEMDRLLILSWIIYASFYLCRVNFSIAMPHIGLELKIGELELGFMASGFFATYSIGQLINGYLNVKYDVKRMLVIGVLGSSISTLILGFSYNYNLDLILWVLNGYFQSIGWPSTVKLISINADMEKLGRRFGLFNTSWTLGHAISWLATGIIIYSFGWRMSFIFNGFAFLTIALAAVTLIPQRNIDYHSGGEKYGKIKVMKDLENLKIKFLILLSIIFLLSDGVRYGLITYLPSYIYMLENSTLNATYTSIVLPLAGSIGMPIIGWFSDKVKYKIAPLIVLTVFTALMLAEFPKIYVWNKIYGIVILILISILLYGLQSQVTSAIPVEISGVKYSSFSAGMINAVGSLGAFIFNLSGGAIIDYLGYLWLFSLWSLTQILQAVILLYAHTKYKNETI